MAKAGWSSTRRSCLYQRRAGPTTVEVLAGEKEEEEHRIRAADRRHEEEGKGKQCEIGMEKG